MKGLRIALIGALTLGLAAAARPAADVSGTWSFKVSLTGGPSFTQTFVFKQEGARLTGTRSGAMGEGNVTGTVTGDNITFGWSEEKSPAITFEYLGKVSSKDRNEGHSEIPERHRRLDRHKKGMIALPLAHDP